MILKKLKPYLIVLVILELLYINCDNATNPEESQKKSELSILLDSLEYPKARLTISFRIVNSIS